MLEISQKLSDWLALSNEQINTTRPLIRGGIADVPVLKMLFTIHENHFSRWLPCFVSIISFLIGIHCMLS